MDYTNCTLCPRNCGVDRRKTTGFCGMPNHIVASKAMAHYGEEPPISGLYGTGAVFFSGCTMRCSFCQNHEISISGNGKPLDSKRLREIFEELVDQGVQSIDLVTPTHFLPDILPALWPKLPVPVVYNCGGYESVETLRELEGLIDIYLPDFKYSNGELAKQLSYAPDYPEICRAALTEMYRQVGGLQMEENMMKRGMIVRHLVLPGYLDNTLGVLEVLDELFPKRDVAISLMSQYMPRTDLSAPLNRKVTEEEYAGAVSWMEFLGLTRGWTQDRNSATDEYLPDFNFDGL